MSDITAIPEFGSREAARNSAPRGVGGPSAGAVDPGALPRIPARAGSAVLGLHLSHPAGGRPGHRLPQPAGGRAARSPPSRRELAQSLRQEKLLDVQQLSAAAAEEALRNGQGRAAGRAGRRTERWSTATTTPIPKAAPRACWPIAPSSAPPAASIRWRPATASCASRARATSIS